MRARVTPATLAAMLCGAIAGAAIASEVTGIGEPARAVPSPTFTFGAASLPPHSAVSRLVNASIASGLRSPSNARTNDAELSPARLHGLTAPFQANTGDHDARVAYVAQTFAGTTFVTRDGRLVHSLPGAVTATKARVSGRDARGPPRGRGWVLTETFVGARPLPQGGAPSETHVSRFVGSDPSRWRSDVPAFDSVLLGEAWPGIRVEVVARGRSVEKIFTVAPGADPRRIAVRVGGAKRLAIAADGALVAHTGNGPVSFSAPVAWQDVDGQRRAVRVAYGLDGKRYRFVVGRYDRAHPLVIDPLLQSTYLGGSGSDGASALAIAANGDVYVTGTTDSPDFPGTAGGFQPVAAGMDAFVAKLDRTLTTLVQTTFLGGTYFDGARGLALDHDGNVIVAGYTSSWDFPGTTGGAQPVHTNGILGFVAKLDPGLTTLIQATYLGGYATYASAVAVSPSGNVFVCGETKNSLNTGFPGTAGGAQPSPGYWFSGYDGFVAKLDKGLTTLVQATYLGGSEEDFAASMAIDAAGRVYVAGGTKSPDFPAIAGSAQPARAGSSDAFVAKLDGSLHCVSAVHVPGRQRGSDSVARSRWTRKVRSSWQAQPGRPTFRQRRAEPFRPRPMAVDSSPS